MKTTKILFTFISCILFYVHPGYNQSIVKLNTSGTVGNPNLLLNNSTSDFLGNIYYCTVDHLQNGTLNVVSLTKELTLNWSYNYTIGAGGSISGVHYLNGKIFISCSFGNNTELLIIDSFGNILFSKRFLNEHASFTSALMNNQDLILTSDIRPSDGTVEISRWTPQFTPIFNKRISFTNRDDVHIYYVKQIGTRIYFGGTSKETGIYHSYGFIAALELDGTLAFLKEYEVISNDLYPNTSIVALDSVDENTILAAGYVNDANPIDGNFNSYADGLIVKLDPKDGSVKDYLILSPKKESDYLYFLGIKYQANNKIRISGAQGINQDFLNTGLLYGELDLNFHDIQFKFSKSYSILTRLEKFIDYNHISGRSENFGIFTTHVGSGICNSNVSCFEKAEIISINKELRFVSNRYEFTNLSYTAEDITIIRKPIPTTLSAPCGVSICSSSQTIPICKQKYIYDYRSIPQIPTAVTNLTPSIAFMTHDKINKKIILDPITSGVALVLFETQLDLFTKQQDTLKFIINNDSLPDLNLGLDKTICQGDSLVLSFGLDSTRWFDGSISKNKTIKTAGKYWGSYFNECGSKSDTILITLEQKPNLMLGADFLICGNLPAQIVSNYDNTIWNTGQSGRSISVTNSGRYVGFVSSACGTSFDTIQVNKFDRSAFDAGLDQKTCDTETLLNANFMNPYPNLYTSKINWKQIDALTAVNFSAIDILNPLITNLTKDQLHSFELSITLNSSCELKDTVHVFSQTCFIDSCAFLIDKICLPNGMIELRALDSNGNLISAKPRQRELLWNIQDGPSKSTYSIFNKNPIVVSNHTIIGLTSKIYSWKKGYPKTIEYADICESKTRDSLNLSCTGPCEDFSFVLSSCDDDSDFDLNLNFPFQYCKSICDNSCDYIIGIFDLNGNLVDPNSYSIKWSTGETKQVSIQKGCLNYNISVEIRRGDCVWFGRYRESCNHAGGNIIGDQNEFKQNRINNLDMNTLINLKSQQMDYSIYNLYGQFIGTKEFPINKLTAGLYFIVQNNNAKRIVHKIFISDPKVRD